MKRRHKKAPQISVSAQKESMRTLLRQSGRLVHGTRGKPTRGPRGNKR